MNCSIKDCGGTIVVTWTARDGDCAHCNRCQVPVSAEFLIEEVDRIRSALASAQQVIEQQDAVAAEYAEARRELWRQAEEARSALTAVDDPSLDATDAAHPAWHRGDEHGTDMTAEALACVAMEGHRGVFASERVEEAANLIQSLRSRLAAAERERDSVREEVRWFAGEMEAKLKANDHKGHWSNCTAEYLFRRIREELDELETAWGAAPRGHVIREAADVANFAMMIADRVRRLGKDRDG